MAESFASASPPSPDVWRRTTSARRAAGREPKPVPDSPRLIATFFDRHGVAELLGGQATRPADPTLAKSVTRIGTNAPVALRRSAELIDRAAELPIEQGLALELSHLREIFATKDAYEGLLRARSVASRRCSSSLVWRERTIGRIRGRPTVAEEPSVGPITATAFIAALDDVGRFEGAAQVTSYLGLGPRELGP